MNSTTRLASELLLRQTDLELATASEVLPECHEVGGAEGVQCHRGRIACQANEYELPSLRQRELHQKRSQTQGTSEHIPVDPQVHVVLATFSLAKRPEPAHSTHKQWQFEYSV